MMRRWSVAKLDNNKWGVFDHGTWFDTFNTLHEAHTYATQLAVADCLFAPGGLNTLRSLQDAGAVTSQ